MTVYVELAAFLAERRVRFFEKKSEETVVVETGQQSTEKDFETNEKELIKELGRKVVNWKAVQQLQMLTFAKRWEKIKVHLTPIFELFLHKSIDVFKMLFEEKNVF